MGVALRGLNLRMAEEIADHRQRHATRNEQRREGVAQIVDADGGQFCLRPDIFPKQHDDPSRPANPHPPAGAAPAAACAGSAGEPASVQLLHTGPCRHPGGAEAFGIADIGKAAVGQHAR